MPKNILVAPLNWGLGHATRCIPIINELINEGYNPIIASDGVALQLLQKEFPKLKTLELSSYKIKYAKKGYLFLFRMLLNIPNIINAIYKEQKLLKKWISAFPRFPDVLCVYIKFKIFIQREILIKN